MNTEEKIEALVGAKRQGLTQSQYCRAAGVSNGAVSDYLRRRGTHYSRLLFDRGESRRSRLKAQRLTAAQPPERLACTEGYAFKAWSLMSAPEKLCRALEARLTGRRMVTLASQCETNVYTVSSFLKGYGLRWSKIKASDAEREAFNSLAPAVLEGVAGHWLVHKGLSPAEACALYPSLAALITSLHDGSEGGQMDNAAEQLEKDCLCHLALLKLHHPNLYRDPAKTKNQISQGIPHRSSVVTHVHQEAA